jgi:antitoxin VapB
MTLSIEHPEADRLAQELARRTGETVADATVAALRERLERLQRGVVGRRLSDELMEIGRHCAALPVLDERSADEILGYDENGLPR